MAILNISEFYGPAATSEPMLVSVPAAASQNVAVGGTSAQSTALAAGTRIVRLSSDVACRVQFGIDPTAAATSLYLPANTVEYFAVEKGAQHKIAVIAA